MEGVLTGLGKWTQAHPCHLSSPLKSFESFHGGKKMVLNSFGNAHLPELWNDHAAVGHQLKSGGGRFGTLMQHVVRLTAARCCCTRDLQWWKVRPNQTFLWLSNPLGVIPRPHRWLTSSTCQWGGLVSDFLLWAMRFSPLNGSGILWSLWILMTTSH